MFTICEGWDPRTVWYSSCETEAHWGSARWNLRTIEHDRDVTDVHPLVREPNRARNSALSNSSCKKSSPENVCT